MILKDLSFALRNLRRNKLLAAINALGLSIGISACLVIFLIASYELSFDKFQPDRDRIYRVYSTHTGAMSGSNPGIPTAVPVAIRDHFTGVESLTNFHTSPGRVQVPQENAAPKDFGHHSKVILAAPDYFDVFNYYEWIVGNPEQSLTGSFQAVISESRARVYFGNVEPLSVIGKEIVYRDSITVTVSGVIKDISERTDLDFTDFISFGTIEKSWLANEIELNSWGSINSASQCFIKLSADTRVEKVEEQILGLHEIRKVQHEDWGEWSTQPKLQALADLHFNTELGIFDMSRSVMEESTLYILIAVAGLLLTIAVINFINLETAQASRRAKEVGVRKVLGSSRLGLISRFLSESFILSVLAVILSVVWTKLSFNYFLDYIPEGLELDFTDSTIVVFLLLCIVTVTILAGLYPAVVMASYRPALALKNLAHSNTGASRSGVIRKSLTIFQFSFAQILLVYTFVIGSQLHYMLNKDLGFHTDAVVFFGTPWREGDEKRLVLKNELMRIPEIETLSIHGSPPLWSGSASSTISYDNGKEIFTHQVFSKSGDTSYIRVYDIEILAGRNLLPTDTVREFLINETYMRLLGFSDPRAVVGEVLDEEAIIAGVVKDFHMKSLHTEVPPMVIYTGKASNVGVKLHTPGNKISDLKPALEKIEAAWKKIYPEYKFQYSFISEEVKRFYENEQRARSLAQAASGIALLISCLGLFGLSTFTVIQRTKEIGIRKVLGATVNNIVILLSTDFVKLVSSALVVSVPVAYYAADRWLQGFAYRMELSPWIFVLTGLFSVVIAFVTISFRTVNAAKADPVKSLRYE